MARGSNDIDLIVKLIREQDEKRSIQIKGLHKNMESAFDAFNIKLDTIKDENHALGLLIQKNHENIKVIKKETTLWRWVHRNPKLSFIIFGIFFSGLTGVFGHLDKEKVEILIKKLIGL